MTKWSNFECLNTYQYKKRVINGDFTGYLWGVLRNKIETAEQRTNNGKTSNLFTIKKPNQEQDTTQKLIERLLYTRYKNSTEPLPDFILLPDVEKDLINEGYSKEQAKEIVAANSDYIKSQYKMISMKARRLHK